MSAIVCTNVGKAYGTADVISGFDLTIDDHEFVVLLGPSGCGKSTLLRMLAGLEEISSGAVSIDGTVVNELPPRDRGVAMVFQNYALYPHMNIFDNIAFGLRRQRTPAAEITSRVESVASMLGLEPYLERKPAALSGGQQQRVAIARAMIKTPKVFLFDEPLSNLDAKLRHHMRVEIAKLHQSLKTTTVYVTHDQLEAMTLADRIVLMRRGFIEQVGSPREIYEDPATSFVASFIGTPTMNFLKATAVARAGAWGLSVGSDRLAISGEHFDLEDGQDVLVGIRPHDLALGSDGDLLSVVGTVAMTEYHGNDVLVTIAYQGETLSALVPASVSSSFTRGDRLRFKIAEPRLHLFDARSEKTLRRKP